MNDGRSQLHMVRLRLRTEKVFALGRRRKLPLRGFDAGYMVHCQMGELFGETAPTPFEVVDSRGRYLTILAYSGHNASGLKDHADAFADPGVHSGVDWESFASKPMPERWETGRRVGFELRACPVVRMASEGPKHRKGAEVDAFLARSFREPDVALDRQEIYREWLENQVAHHGGASLIRVGVDKFKRERLLRPTHQGKPRTRSIERPDVTFSGEVEVTEDAVFRALLRRGIGRHRAFGFGMLLLRPVERG